MSYEVYKTLHLMGLVLTFTSLIAMIAIQLLKSDADEAKKIFKKFFIAHGIGVTILIISGFGLAARLGFFAQMPTWIYVKIALWGCAVILASIVKRKLLPTILIYALCILIPIIGSIVAVNKPF
ncbi:MAG: hypothetical protein L6Q37_10145 [Bdellovibrionaceae bacterium]|nr:hypothetical protein [Pseudobdellovibrionaceae bacterium]NUM58913.1 hypothetical protein [Pseudobdellovibrionaceae bacterium]